MERNNSLTAKELLELAATNGKHVISGRNREEDGVVPGWHEWAAQHSQREDTITICRGRKEWQAQNDDSNLNQLSVVSWNILSDTWWRKGKGEYERTLPEEGDWEYRLPRILQWIGDLIPDILAVQELDHVKFDMDLLPALQAWGYEGVMQRPKKKASTHPCGNATFWKSKKYRLNRDASFSRSLCVVLDRISEGEHDDTLQTTVKLCVANVHLEASQSDVGMDRRARQMNSALAYAASEAPDAALLVCGDYNTGADSQLFRVLREYQWHGHSLSSVYEHPDTHGTLPVSVATFLWPGHHYVIDHMLYTQRSLRLECALDAFSITERDQHINAKGMQSGFPTAFCPSDHVPIGAMFEFLPQQRNIPKQHIPANVVAVSKLSAQREMEILQQWQVLQSQRPPQITVKGKPSPNTLAARKKYSASVKAWKESMKNNDALEYEFATKLTKESKK